MNKIYALNIIFLRLLQNYIDLTGYKDLEIRPIRGPYKRIKLYLKTEICLHILIMLLSDAFTLSN